MSKKNDIIDFLIECLVISKISNKNKLNSKDELHNKFHRKKQFYNEFDKKLEKLTNIDTMIQNYKKYKFN